MGVKLMPSPEEPFHPIRRTARTRALLALEAATVVVVLSPHESLRSRAEPR
jgi:hypothetical protein